MTFLKFLMLLALVVWIGGIVFFAAVLAPTVFALLPSRHLAGNVVNRSLAVLHIMGLVCGLVFLVCSMIQGRFVRGGASLLAPRHIAIIVMLALTVWAHFGIARRMQHMREQMGVIDELSVSDPRRIDFNQMHGWSTRVEGVVLLFGLGVLWGTARRLS